MRTIRWAGRQATTGLAVVGLVAVVMLASERLKQLLVAWDESVWADRKARAVHPTAFAGLPRLMPNPFDFDGPLVATECIVCGGGFAGRPGELTCSDHRLSHTHPFRVLP